MQKRFESVWVGVVLLFAAGSAVADNFVARLGRVPVESRTQADIQGLGNAEAELDGNRLIIVGEFAGLVGPATQAGLYMGRAVGARGPVIDLLEVTESRAGKLSGSVRLDAGQMAALRAGRLYIRIDSENATDGNLWGWLFSE